jgi:hypothetical protein
VPYVRACAAVTIALVVLAVFALARLLARRLDPPVAALAAAGTWCASTIPYYTLAQPAMAHGLVFALAVFALVALERAARTGAGRDWALCGALAGGVMLCRWQAVLFALVPAAVGIACWRAGRVRVRALAVGAACAVAAFLPQLVAWKIGYGRWLVMPQGSGYVDWSSPRLLDVLVSADRGLLAWTPVVALGTAALPLSARRWGWPATAAALAVAALTAWVNGGVKDFSGGEAFGARRFDVVVPLAAFGVAELALRLRAAVAARPLLAPAALLAAAALWNAGLVRLFRYTEVKRAAPLDRLAAQQVAQARDGLDALAERLSPALRRALYALFVGEFLYETVPGGDLRVSTADARFLDGGWSPPRARPEWPAFRWALYPEACWSLPLGQPHGLTLTVDARAPGRLDAQTVAVVVNGRAGAEAPLPGEWTTLALPLRAEDLFAGPNRVCLRFSRALAGDDGETAAAVARAEIP